MPDLKNLLRHMKGRNVSVNGTVYDIDLSGVAHDVKSEDAEKLLMGQHWETTVPTPEVPPPALLGDDGEPLTDDDEGEVKYGEPDESMDIDVLKMMADHFDVSYGPNIGKALLIERIKEAMGEPGAEDDEPRDDEE